MRAPGTRQTPHQAPRASTRRAIRRAVIAVCVVLVSASGCATPQKPVAQAQAPAPPVDPGWPMRAVETGFDVELAEPFVRLVDLSRLRVGMTKAEVRALFPDPQEIELRQGDEFWQYGFAELIFRDGRLRDWFNL